MTHRCFKRIAVAIALNALLGASTWAGAQSRLTSLSDVLPFEPPAADECPKTRVTGRASAPLSLEQAVGNFNAALEGSVSPQAMRALEASPAWKDAALASKWAAAAAAADKPLAAAALALRAHRLAPGEPLYAHNLAAIANVYGRHAEALALASAAEALGKGGKTRTKVARAQVLTNKANALIGMGRATEAETALKEAIQLQPDLSEAYLNMAYALGQQNRCAEAAKYLGAGLRRAPAKTLNPPKETEPPAAQEPGKRSAPRDEPAEAEDEAYLPASLAFDLTRGKRGLLPMVPVPTSLEEAAAALAAMRAIEQRVLAEVAGMRGELARAQAAEQRRAALETKMGDGTLAEQLSAWRSRELRKAVGRFAREGRTRDAHLDRLLRMKRDAYQQFARAERRAAERKVEADMQALDRLTQRAEANCSGIKDVDARNVCGERYRWEWEQAKCASHRRYIEEKLPQARALDNAVRSDFHESYLYATAAASYLRDPDNVTVARFKLKVYEINAQAEVFKALTDAFGVNEEVLAKCKAGRPKPVAASTPRNDPSFCALPDGAKLKASAAEVVELALNCDQVEVKVSTPGPLNLFVQVGYDKSERARKMADEKARKEEQRANRNPSNPMGLREFGSKGPERVLDGELTVFVGAGVKSPTLTGKPPSPGPIGPLPPTEMEAQVGGFIKVGHYGGVVDFGARATVSDSVSVDAGAVSVGVQLDATTADVSFVSTPAPTR